MAAEVVGGAALGAAFGLLIDAVKEAKQKRRMFRPAIKDISCMLEYLNPLIEQIAQFNRVLNQPTVVSETFVLELEEGEKLIRTCLKVHPLNLRKLRTYTNRLIDLKQSLERLLKILQVELARDVKESLGLLWGINTRLQRIEGSISLIGTNGVEDYSLVGVEDVSLVGVEDVSLVGVEDVSLVGHVTNSSRSHSFFGYNWEKGVLLGRGSFASVYEGIAENGLLFALKEVSLLDQSALGRQSVYQLEQEIALLSKFEHENIVQYLGTDKDDSNLYIFLELVTKGSLQSLYQRYTLWDQQVSAYTRQILHGLKYLHDQNVVHRDIKCANILVHASGSVKLVDFGLAEVTTLNGLKTCKGTAFWMAPEVVNGKGQGCGIPADIWSLGCTVLEMLTRKIPYSELEPMLALFKIGKGVPPSVPEDLSRDARDFILQCIQVNPNHRPTAANLLNHPFIRRPVSTSSGPTYPYHPGGRS